MVSKSLFDRITKLEAETMASEPEIRAFCERTEAQAAAFPDEAAAMTESERDAKLSYAQRIAWRRRFGGLVGLKDLVNECRRAACPSIFIAMCEASPTDLRL